LVMLSINEDELQCLHEERVLAGITAVHGDNDRTWWLNLDLALQCAIVNHCHEEEGTLLLLNEA